MRRIACLLILLGASIVVGTTATLWCFQIVDAAFNSSTTAGLITLLGLCLIGSSVAYLLWNEMRGYLEVRRVDFVTDALARADYEMLQDRASRWAKSAGEEAACIAIQSAKTIEEINTILEQLFKKLDNRVDLMIAKESALVGGVVGLSPWPLVDGCIVGWRHLRLIKRIALVYGLRPSTLGTLRLLRHISIALIFADLSEHASQWFASNVPSLGGILPKAGQAVAVGVLTVRVGRACKRVCKPELPKS
ncbi:MAG: YcjF family protein [Phycisphaerales bacterium]|jgi:putative membrane protein|nr:YcjF family protein [Phycisphaerales bacterium]